MSAKQELPPYYSELAPFRPGFSQGTPILTYHHIAAPVRGARLKGLYLGPRLFDRQLRELGEASFRTGHLEDLVSPHEAPGERCFLTIDDGFEDVFTHGLPILTKHRSVATLFLVSDLIGKTNLWQQQQGDIVEKLMDQAQVKAWLQAGQAIGAHTRTHPRLTHLSLAEAREEISGSKKSLEDAFGQPIQHFCYPYGDWNQAVRDLVAEAGYQTACTTITGINESGTDRFALKRVTARYPSRNLKAVWARLKGRCGC